MNDLSNLLMSNSGLAWHANNASKIIMDKNISLASCLRNVESKSPKFDTFYLDFNYHIIFTGAN